MLEEEDAYWIVMDFGGTGQAKDVQGPFEDYDEVAKHITSSGDQITWLGIETNGQVMSRIERVYRR